MRAPVALASSLSLPTSTNWLGLAIGLSSCCRDGSAPSFARLIAWVISARPCPEWCDEREAHRHRPGYCVSTRSDGPMLRPLRDRRLFAAFDRSKHSRRCFSLGESVGEQSPVGNSPLHHRRRCGHFF